MSLSQHQIRLVQSSFAKVEPISDTAAELFYAKLFEYDPKLKALFKGDMRQQGRKLMSLLKIAVNGLNNLGALVPALEKLAVQHLDYGVSVHDYTPVGNALLHALSVGLGDDFTPEVRTAWVEVYKIVANTMRSAAYPGFNPDTYENPLSYAR